jgi:hypothetical protein
MSRGACLLAAIAAVAVAGCGSDSEPKPKPDVAGRAVVGDRFLGLPLITEFGDVVLTDPEVFSTSVPGLYPDPDKAIAEQRRDGFVAGIIKVFKEGREPASSSSAVVQMRDAEGATAEFNRQVAAAEAPACPDGLKCTRDLGRFDVPGVPGAAGVQTTLHIEGDTGEHPDELHSTTVVFRKGAFVYQVFLGAEEPGEKERDRVIDAALAEYSRQR